MFFSASFRRLCIYVSRMETPVIVDLIHRQRGRFDRKRGLKAVSASRLYSCT